MQKSFYLWISMERLVLYISLFFSFNWNCLGICWTQHAQGEQRGVTSWKKLCKNNAYSLANLCLAVAAAQAAAQAVMSSHNSTNPAHAAAAHAAAAHALSPAAAAAATAALLQHNQFAAAAAAATPATNPFHHGGFLCSTSRSSYKRPKQFGTIVLLRTQVYKLLCSACFWATPLPP